jgi:hypothetical protein
MIIIAGVGVAAMIVIAAMIILMRAPGVPERSLQTKAAQRGGPAPP